MLYITYSVFTLYDRVEVPPMIKLHPYFCVKGKYHASRSESLQEESIVKMAAFFLRFLRLVTIQVLFSLETNVALLSLNTAQTETENCIVG